MQTRPIFLFYFFPCKLILALLSSLGLDKCSINLRYFLSLFIVKPKRVDLRPRTSGRHMTSWETENIPYYRANVRRLIPASDFSRALFLCLNCAHRFHQRSLGSSRKLGGAAEHLTDDSEKHVCRLSF